MNEYILSWDKETCPTLFKRKEYKKLQEEFPGAFLDENIYEITVENIEMFAKANKRVHPSTTVKNGKDVLLENELKLCESINKKN